MERGIHPVRIEEIKNNSIPFPLFYYEEEDLDNVSSALYITNMDGNSPLNMPNTFQVVKEDDNKLFTIATYVLESTYKTAAIEADPQDN